MWVTLCFFMRDLFGCITDIVVTSNLATARINLTFTVDKTLDISCSALPSTPQIQLTTGKLTFTAIPGTNFNSNGPKSIVMPCPDMTNAIEDCIPTISSMSSAALTIKSTTSGSAFQYSTVVPTIVVSRFNYDNCWAEIDILQSVYEGDGAIDIIAKPLYCDIPTAAKLYAIFRISEIETVTFPLQPQSIKANGYLASSTDYVHTKTQTFKINCSTISSSTLGQTMTATECTRVLRTFIGYPYRLARLALTFDFANSSSIGSVVVIQPSTRVRDNSTALCFSNAYMRLYRDKMCMELEAPTVESSGCALDGDVKNIYFYFSLSDNIDPSYAGTKCYYTRLDPDFTFNTSIRSQYWYTCKDKVCKDTFSSIINHHNTSVAKYGVYMTNLAGQEVKRLLFTAYPLNVTCFSNIYVTVMDTSICAYFTLPLDEDYCNVLQLPDTTLFKIKLWYTAGTGIESANVKLAGEFNYIGKFSAFICFTCSDHWVPNDKYFNGKYCGSQLSFVKSQYKKDHSYITIGIGDVIEVPDDIYFLDDRGLLIASLVLAFASIIITVVIVTLEFLRICKKKGHGR
ncbi:hypothetical protein QR46_2532 [Giardia duodenalis assemblage B]|uniref:Uncharacterized protein n=1 Tax=Giardia duodenalis assemblage B TaxID=1394984 RepID=A0A132NTP5_GIAIN|nr:hypothetical protein QR46_2532 [Giardia intestinalis assemblage B]